MADGRIQGTRERDTVQRARENEVSAWGCLLFLLVAFVAGSAILAALRFFVTYFQGGS